MKPHKFNTDIESQTPYYSIYVDWVDKPTDVLLTEFENKSAACGMIKARWRCPTIKDAQKLADGMSKLLRKHTIKDTN